MDRERQITRSWGQGMVKIIVVHQANAGPGYGGPLSKYFHAGGKSCLDELREQLSGVVREVILARGPDTEAPLAEDHWIIEADCRRGHH
jgi:hypothetical protein